MDQTAAFGRHRAQSSHSGHLIRLPGLFLAGKTITKRGRDRLVFYSIRLSLHRFSNKKVHIELYISELLYANDCVIIPGLGGFVANTRSAFLNPAQHTFTPPSRRLAFNAILRTNDGLLVHYVSRRQGVNYGEAMSAIKVWVDDVLARLHRKEQVFLPQIGTLVFDAAQRIQFEPDITTNYLTDAFGLVGIHSPAIRRDEPAAKVRRMGKEQKKGRRQGWRLLELIPVAAMLAILALYPAVIQTLNTELASLFPLKELFTAPAYQQQEVKAESVPQQSSVAAAIVEPAPASESAPAPAPPAATLAADTTRVAPALNPVAPARLNNAANGTFYVIGGCFRSEENARKLVEEADLMGYNATVIGVNEKGLHMVSLFSSADIIAAQSRLAEIRAGFEEGAWMLSR